jgi:hypothetical protein
LAGSTSSSIAKEERRKMRDESQAPRNSRELAVRNQFFTPRYVVQFLVDNTLGRIWVEMHGETTRLNTICEYLVRSADESVQSRPRKDPRDLRILDPACGSGHFLLYSFDLLLTIYEESWSADGSAPTSEATGRALRDDYPNLVDLRREAPKLIVEQNLYGVDIDPRCAQIAALVLWLRAQRAWKDLGIPASDRPRLQRTHIITAEPMPGEKDLLNEFLHELKEDRLEGLLRRALAISPERTVRATKAMASSLVELVTVAWDAMKLAGEMGTLLKIERDISRAVEKGRGEWVDRLPLFRVAEYGLGGSVKEKLLPVMPGEDDDFWSVAEKLVFQALAQYAAAATGMGGARRRMFAQDAAQGFALADLVAKRFDVVLMNPPFGEFVPSLFSRLAELYPDSKRDLGIAFIERGVELLSDGGIVGALVSRKPFFVDTQGEWRARFPGRRHFVAFADLGHRVLDNALVEVAAVAIRESDGPSKFIDCLAATNKQTALLEAVQDKYGSRVVTQALSTFGALPSTQFAYTVDSRLLAVFRNLPAYEPLSGVVRMGLTTSDNDRFIRLWWELDSNRQPGTWVPVVKGGEYAPYFAGFELMVKWNHGHGDMAAYNLSTGNEAQSRRGSRSYFKPALTYTERTASRFSARIMPAGAIFTGAGPAILPNDENLLFSHLAIFASWCFGALYEICLGGGDAVHSGAAARHYTSGLLGQMPFPTDLTPLSAFEDDIEDILILMVGQKALEDTSPYSCRVELRSATNPVDLARAIASQRVSAAATIVEKSGRIEEAVAQIYLIDLKASRTAIAGLVGPHPDWLPPCELDAITADTRRLVNDLFALPMDALVDRVTEILGNARYLALKSYCGDRRLELVAHAVRLHPRSLAQLISRDGILAAGDLNELVASVIDQTCRRLWLKDEVDNSGGAQLTAKDIAYDKNHIESLLSHSISQSTIYADDPGHPSDFASAFGNALAASSSVQFEAAVSEHLTGRADGWREYFASTFFAEHIKRRTLHRRSAPIYWQLATPSACYSVWLYLHAFTKDTLYKVQNDYVAVKLEHEERRLESLRRELGESPNLAERKTVAAQETFVDELRTFLKEVKCVAPLWNPHHDDGVLINFAPLWRLVPHHKPWQKELKATWDALCCGDYDWAHLAMHLWPERVVPKCTTDRSLAIAHGLEDVFWVEGDNGKWKPRPSPMRPVDDLVRERASIAVKAALKSLLEAATANANGGRAHGRRVANAVADGGTR